MYLTVVVVAHLLSCDCEVELQACSTHLLFTQTNYRVVQKTWEPVTFLPLTSSNLNWFLKLFHYWKEQTNFQQEYVSRTATTWTCCFTTLENVRNPFSCCFTEDIVQYGMYSHRICLLKLIFFASLESVGLRLSENKGVQIFQPLPLFGGHFRFGPPIELICTYFCHLLTDFKNLRLVL